MINTGDPQSLPLVIHIFTRAVYTYVPTFQKILVTKQTLSENDNRYWRDCRSGRVDH